MKQVLFGNEMDRMPDWGFKMMTFMFKIADIFKSPENRLVPFNLQTGNIVIDYGSGTGRYIRYASGRVGDTGIVYAVDILELAIRSAYRQIEKHHLKNVKPILTDGKTVTVPSHAADIVYALDMFHMVRDTEGFLKELHRVTKPDGILYLEDGHQPRTLAREKVCKSGYWEILEETKGYMKCRPLMNANGR